MILSFIRFFFVSVASVSWKEVPRFFGSLVAPVPRWRPWRWLAWPEQPALDETKWIQQRNLSKWPCFQSKPCGCNQYATCNHIICKDSKEKWQIFVRTGQKAKEVKVFRMHQAHRCWISEQGETTRPRPGFAFCFKNDTCFILVLFR